MSFIQEFNDNTNKMDWSTNPLRNFLDGVADSIDGLNRKVPTNAAANLYNPIFSFANDLKKAFSGLDAKRLADPEAIGEITTLVNDFQRLFSDIPSGKFRNVNEFTTEYEKLIERFTSILGQGNGLDAEDHIKHMKAFFNYLFKAQSDYEKATIKVLNKDTQKANILGITPDKLKDISNQVIGIVDEFNKKISSGQDGVNYN